MLELLSNISLQQIGTIVLFYDIILFFLDLNCNFENSYIANNFKLKIIDLLKFIVFNIYNKFNKYK